MHRNRCGPRVRMFEENVAAAGANHLETDSFEDTDDLPAFYAGKPGHTKTC